MQPSSQQHWTQLAKRTTRLINWGWWIDSFVPVLVSLTLTTSVALLILRSQFPTVPIGMALLTGGAALLLAAFGALLIARKRFISLETAFVRLEKHLHLHNALTVARAGIGKWPPAPAHTPHLAGLQFHWPKILLPLLLVSLTLVAALWLPIPPTNTKQTPTNEPPAWAQMDTWLDTLSEETIVEEKPLEEIRTKIEQLRDLDKQDWFSHSSLEATDTLSSQLRNSIRKLGLESATAEQSLAMLNALDGSLSKTARDRLSQQYRDALTELAANQLPLNSALLNQLKNLDLSQLANLSPEQLKGLKGQLNKTSTASQKCLGMQLGELGSSRQAELDALLLALKSGTGSGGISRGPGTAPVTLSNSPKDLHTNNIAPVETGDFSRATLGDLLGEADGEHDIDTTITGPSQAGAISATGKGGTLIWRDTLVPKEKEILKKYFD